MLQKIGKQVTFLQVGNIGQTAIRSLMQKKLSTLSLTEVIKDQKYEIRIPIAMEDMCKLWRYEHFFRTCIEKGYRPRPTTLKQFALLLEKSLVNDFETKSDFFTNIKKGLLEKLTDTGYSFRIENLEQPDFLSGLLSKKIKLKESLRVYSIIEFVDNFFNKILSDEALQRIITSRNRAKFIEDAFSELYEYLKRVPVDIQPSFYAYTVIVGQLAASLGIIISEEDFTKSPSNHRYYTAFLNNTTKHICKKAKMNIDIKRRTATR